MSFHNPKIFLNFLKSKKASEKNWQKNLSLFQTLDTFPLPDFSNCHLPDGRCSCMTPQGICTTEHYILITAYCNIKRFQKDLKTTPLPKLYQSIKSEKAHSSCLMVFDKKSHQYLALLELPDQNHVGGITCDGTYIWIAKSTTNCLSMIKEKDLNHLVKYLISKKTAPGKMQNIMSADARNQIQHFQKEPVPSAKIDYFQKEIPCDMTASFVTFFSKRIWVGFCAPAGKKGMLRSFQIQKNPQEHKHPFSLIPDREWKIPAKANGASFYENQADGKNQIYLFLSISGGRKNASDMLIYHIKHAYPLLLHRFTLPPLLEESCIDADILYTLYESSSPAYRDVPGNSCPFPVDVVSMADVKNFL